MVFHLLRNLFRHNGVERDLDEELRAALDTLVDEKVCAGMLPEEARRASRAELGAVEAIKDNVRDARAGAWFECLGRDLRHASRGLRKNAGLSASIVTTFALGSAGAIAMFAVVNAILIQPLPYPHAERLVAIRHAAPGLGLTDVGLSVGTYSHYRRHATSIEALAIFRQTALNLSPPGSVTERVNVTFAGPELFELLGVSPLHGRLFTAEDGRPGFRDTRWPIPVLLSHELWQRRYGGDPALVGRTITLSDRPRTVVGVLPADFAFPDPDTQIWMLSIPDERTASFASEFEYGAIARLRPGTSTEAAETELSELVPTMEGAFRDATAARLAEVALKPFVIPLKDRLAEEVRSLLLIVFGGMALLLIVGGANMTSLFLLRTEQRNRETAIRGALGARRADLLRLFFSEAVLLSVAGAAAGMLLGHAALSMLIRLAPAQLPRVSEVGVDGWVIAFAGVLAFSVALMLAGVACLTQFTTLLVPSTPRASAGVTATRGSRRYRDLLVAMQVAIALTLLLGSALMVQTLRSLHRIDSGFEPRGMLTIEVGLPGSKARQHQQIYDDVLQRVRALPGVTNAGAVSTLPLDDTRADAYPVATTVAPVRTVPPVMMKFVTPGYFQTMKIPVRLGSGFAIGERVDLPDPVVVSAGLARRLFPREDPIGRTILRRGFEGEEVRMWDSSMKRERPIPPWTIVGVVEDTREESLRFAPDGVVYLPIQQPSVERMYVPINIALVIRSDARPASLAGSVQEIIRDVEPSLSVARMRTMEEVIGASVARERFLAVVLLVAAASALFLALVAVFGVAAHAVRRRQQEIGIRVSLGAPPGQLIAMVARHAFVLIVAGIVAGLASALAAARTLRSFLYGVSAADPLTLVLVTGTLVFVAVLAILVPARRAATLDPVAALRAE